MLLLLDAVQVLHAEKVDYAVIGALAASVHGLVRASPDADALLSINPSTPTRLEGRFKAAGFHTELRRGDADDPISAVLALHDGFEKDVAAARSALEVSSERSDLVLSGAPQVLRRATQRALFSGQTAGGRQVGGQTATAPSD